MQDFWTGRRVLVTGHTGFKGSWLALWLTELGARVTGVGLAPNTTPNLFSQMNLEQRIEQHHIADIRDYKTLAEIIAACKPQVVFHLAAQPLVRRSYRDPLGTWSTNVQGSLHVLEGVKQLEETCAIVMVTTDKVYENQEWDYGYRETDRLGGHDPYSASKAAAELAIASWRRSFCGNAEHQKSNLAIASARTGNVIGGGDWAEDRIIPDAMRALASGMPIQVRNPIATRPWQHVLEPLAGYLCLAKKLTDSQSKSIKLNTYCSAFNFGPSLEANRSVQQLIEECLRNWEGDWGKKSSDNAPHEASRLHLQTDKAIKTLKWKPCYDFETTVAQTVSWYQAVDNGEEPLQQCLKNIHFYQSKLKENT